MATFEEDAKVTSLSEEGLSNVSALCAKAQELQARIDKGKKLLEELEASLEEIETKELPDAMQVLGLKVLRLTSGESVEVKLEVHAAIPKKEQVAAFDWLRKKGLDAIIKSKLEYVFGKGEDKLSSQVLAALKKLKVEASLVPSVHAQTLKALAREKLEAGDPLPEKLFGVYTVNRARITK